MHLGCWTFGRYLNILGLQKTSIFFCKVETQILLKISFGELPGYPGMNIHSCPLLLWHSQDLGPRSLLAVLPPPTSTEKTTQGPRPTVLAVLPTPPPPTTQGPRLPGGKKTLAPGGAAITTLTRHWPYIKKLKIPKKNQKENFRFADQSLQKI